MAHKIILTILFFVGVSIGSLFLSGNSSFARENIGTSYNYASTEILVFSIQATTPIPTNTSTIPPSPVCVCDPCICPTTVGEPREISSTPEGTPYVLPTLDTVDPGAVPESTGIAASGQELPVGGDAIGNIISFPGIITFAVIILLLLMTRGITAIVQKD